MVIIFFKYIHRDCLFGGFLTSLIRQFCYFCTHATFGPIIHFRPSGFCEYSTTMVFWCCWYCQPTACSSGMSALTHADDFYASVKRQPHRSADRLLAPTLYWELFDSTCNSPLCGRFFAVYLKHIYKFITFELYFSTTYIIFKNQHCLLTNLGLFVLWKIKNILLLTIICMFSEAKCVWVGEMCT